MRQHLAATPALQAAYTLLCSIPGIGHLTATTLLGEVGDTRQFADARQLVAFAGLGIRHHQSGTKVHGPSRVSKRGSARLRRALYFPAVTAWRCARHWQAFIARLQARGKHKAQILTALMRKLLVLVFAVLRDQRPFDPALPPPRPPMAAPPLPILTPPRLKPGRIRSAASDV